LASPVGHALAGLALGRLAEPRVSAASRLIVPVCIALALLPDLDFLPGVLLGNPTLYHQGESHSLGAALLVSFAVALLLARGGPQLLRIWLVCFAAYGSHLLLDYFGTDARLPIGIPLLWPLSNATWISPVPILPGVHHAGATTDAWLATVFSLANLRAIAIELIVVGPMLLLAELRRRRYVRARAAEAMPVPGERQ
jgi:membrane-bound metal-dependent hydrolase YbcI (DUF457 family)